MKEELLKEKISEMIRIAKGSQFVNYCNSDIPAERSLALDSPEGETAYFKKKIFDLKVQINEQSLIGKNWISGYCQPDVFNSNWIQLNMEVLLNPEYKLNENEVFRQLKLFFDQYVLLSNYEKIIKEIEYKKKAKSQNRKKGQPSMVRARAFCIALIQESGKKNFLKGNLLRMNEIMDFVKEKWGGRGRTVYNECLNIISENNPINKWYKEENPEEYNIGFKLFKEMYPD